MQVAVQLFAGARQFAGKASVIVELIEPCTIANLKTALALAIPALAPLLPSTRFAINMEYASDDDTIPQGAEVAAIPPVSGGSEPR